jgi:hypothetical protein
MVNESALKDTLIAFATQNRTSFITISTLLNEVAALRETVRGLDPTFGDVMGNRRAILEETGAETVRDAIAGYDEIIRLLEHGHVC